jgi:hypothetical protein
MAGDGLYVGYLALPHRHRVFLMVAVPLAVAGMLVGALGLGMAQPSWGDGFWETGSAREFRGTLTLEPYPMLHVDGGDERVSYLVVEMGKFGSAERFAEVEHADGATVAIWGRELLRDGRRMIEIDPAGGEGGSSEAVSVQASDRPAVRVGRETMPVVESLSGEIVDSKCYLGAMKPGDGRGHKACATLCISGGIPPVLVVRGAGDDVSYLLLTDATGRGLRGSGLEAIEPMIATRVELRGQRGRVGSWETFRLMPEAGD